MGTTTTARTVVRAIVPKMQQVKRSVHNMYILLLYTRTAALDVDAHNEVPYQVPGTRYLCSTYYTHDDILVHTKGACFAIPASPPTTLG